MAENIKKYSIVINGLTESIDAVKSLNEQLKGLEERIKVLQDKAINIKTNVSSVGATTSTASKSASSSVISTENEIIKQQNEELRLRAKINAAMDESFKALDATKAQYKEIIADQKQVAAQERINADAYSHTMQGMKQQLADLKAAINTTVIDEPDGLEKISEYTKKANELNEKLLEMEKSYGQFGRQVGNYSSAFDGLDKVRITIGDTVREFGSAREAIKTLNNELKTMALNGQQDTEAFKELRKTVMQLESAVNDAKKPMDDLMDSMEGIMAIASAGQGISALFGIDDSEIQRSIQKLVALQNILQGIQTINKQMETGEGVGKWINSTSSGVDSLVTKLTGAEKRMGLFVGSTRGASIAINALSTALKGLAAIGIVAVISAIAWAAEKAYEAFSDWVKGNDKLIDSEKKLNVVLKATNDELERKLRLNQARAGANKISSTQKQIADEEALAEAIRKTNAEVEKRMKMNPNNSTFAAYASGNKGNEDIFKDKGVTTLGGFTEEIKDAEELVKRYNALSEAVDKNTGLVYKNAKGFEIAHLTASDAKDEFNHLEQMLAGRLYNAMKQFDTTTEEGRKGLQDFVNQIIQSNDVMYKSALLRLPELVDNEKGSLGTALGAWLDLIRQFVSDSNAEMNKLDFEKYANSLIDAADETGKRLKDKQIAQLKDRYNALSEEEKRQQKPLFDSALAAIEKNFKKRSEKANAGYKKIEKDVREAENDLANLRIANMKEGLNKVLKQLEEERKQRLAKVEADGIMVAERQAEINILYDKKILEAKKKWAEETEKVYKDMWDNIYDYSLSIANKLLEAQEIGYENQKRFSEYARDNRWSNMPDYGIQGVAQISEESKKILGIEGQENKELADVYRKRKELIEKYWKDREDFETKAVFEIWQQNEKVIDESYQKELREREKSWKEQQTLQSNWYDKKRQEIEESAKHEKWSQKELDLALLNVDKEYQKAATKLFEEYNEDKDAIDKRHKKRLKQNDADQVDATKKIYMEAFRQRIQELRDFQTAIANLENKQPVINAWGITNFKETNKNNRILLQSYEEQAKSIVKLKEELQKKLDEHQITFDDFQNANRELDSFADNVGQKMDEVKYKLSIAGQIEQFIQDIQMYVQAGLQGIQDVFNAVWDYQDYQFEKEQDELDKFNDELDKKLDEQEKIVEKHKSAIDEIEDELSTARGDRRQHLIDQLNAEMQAQRAAAAQEKKIQQQKEAAEKKQEQLEKKRREEEYKRNVIQAFISWHMAIANGLATQPFLPVGIAMGALATALGAVQYALVKSQKPYAKGGQLDGGVAQGKRHRDGGIPVLGGRASIEGGEFITNRITTQNNVDVLDFINSRHKKLSLDDFINFYSSGKLKKNISSMSPRTAFADGGVIPTISNDIDINDRLLSAMEAYAERPVVVSVVDINNRQNAVKNVQVLAGLE